MEIHDQVGTPLVPNTIGWRLFSRDNPIVEVCDKPIRDIEPDSAAFS